MKKEWLYVFGGGFLEVFWALALKQSHGLRIFPHNLIAIVLVIISFYLFSKGMEALPSGVAYTVYTGIGAIGTILFGILLLGESLTLKKIIFSSILILSIIGMKHFTPEDRVEEQGGDH